MDNVLISIIIPIYNTSEYLPRCVDSVINQTYKNLEIILVDDGSTDSSYDICGKYEHLDSRIKLIHKQNGGLSDARNVGVISCNGEYIIFLDSDDYWLKDDFIEKALPRKHEDIVFFGYSKSVDGVRKKDDFVYKLKDSYLSGVDFINDVLKLDHVFYWYAWRYIIKTSLWKDNCIFFPIGVNYEDSATMYKPLLFSKEITVYKDDVYCYNLRESSITRTPKLDNYINHLNVIKNAIEYINDKKDIDDVTRNKLCDNFASSYIAILIELTLLNDDDQKILLDELKRNKTILRYILYGKQLFAKEIINIIGLKFFSYILSVRRMIKYKR